PRDPNAPPGAAAPEAVATAGNPNDPNAPPAPPARVPLHGELAQVGLRTLVNPYSYWAVGLGTAFLDSRLYAAVSPGFAIYRERWSLALHAPLNLLGAELEGRKVRYGGLRVRREDWADRSNYLKVIRFLNIGHKEDPFFASVSSLQPLSMGHGLLLNRYQGNITLDQSNTSATIDLSNHIAGAQALVNDLTFQNRIVGGLAFVKPAFFAEALPLRTLSVGVETVADLRAPRCVRRGAAAGNPCVRGTGNVAGKDPYTSVSLDETFVNSDPNTGRYVVDTATVQALGASLETKIYQQPEVGDIKAYATWHTFINAGGGAGSAVGLLGRFNLGEGWIHALRLRTEYRTFTDGFLPSYFDTTYEANKYEYGFGNSAYQVTPTKYQAIFGDPKNGFARPSIGRRHGFRVDAQWALFKGGRTGKRLALAAGIEDSTGPNDSSMYLHLELPAFHALQLFVTYLHLNEASFPQL
ncbi:MAG TPA: hypothetical protein VFH51_09550, partial [Myxococcota bacterium]|nr:hypothetical protein [Myxococcota bacterium]